MAQNKKASIIILTYDPTFVYLKRSLPILIKQTYKNKEIIIADSGRTDITKNYIKTILDKHTENEKLIKYVRIQPQSKKEFNYAAVFNQATSFSTGDILVRLSGDAVPSNNQWLEMIVNAFDNFKVGVVFCSQILEPSADRYTRLLDYLILRRYSKPGVRKDIWFSGQAWALKRELWDQHKFNENWKWGEDQEYNLWARKAGYDVFFEPRAKTFHSHSLTIGEIIPRVIKDFGCAVRSLVFYKLNLTT